MTAEESGQAIRAARTQRGMSRAGLGAAIGISPKRVENLERLAVGFLTEPERQRLAECLSIEPAQLAGIVTRDRPYRKSAEGDAKATQPQHVGRRGGGLKMFEQREVLTRAELKQLGLPANPFPDRPEPFWWPELTDALETLEDAIQQHGMVALIGPSGAGKSTVLNQVRTNLAARKDTISVEMSAIDKGKVNDWVMETTLLEALGLPAKAIPAGAERRARKLTELLGKRCRANGRTVLICDDFHDAGAAILKQLRRLRESDPAYFLFGVVFSGQLPLGGYLRSEELREVGGRCQIIPVPPLGGLDPQRRPRPNYGPAFFAHHFRAVGVDMSRWMTEGAAHAIAEQAEHPLWCRNLAVQALKRVAGIGRPVDEALLSKLAR